MGMLESVYRLAQSTIDGVRGYGVINRGGRGVVGLIDVGSVGPLPDPWHRRSDLVSHVLKFEPRDRRGRKRRVVTIDAALWSEPATLPFYVYSGHAGHGSSLFQANVNYVRDNFETLHRLGPSQLAETWYDRVHLDRVEEIQCTTLDTVLADQPDRYHVLKIDAQGAERQILEGATNYLSDGDCLALHLELFRIPLYQGIALRPEVEEMADGLGFSLVREFPPHGTFDSQNDCVFMRRGAAGPVADAIRAAYEL